MVYLFFGENYSKGCEARSFFLAELKASVGTWFSILKLGRSEIDKAPTTGTDTTLLSEISCSLLIYA